MKFVTYSIESKGIPGICKSASIWGIVENENRAVPLVYFKKPKWMQDADYIELVRSLKLNLRHGKDFVEATNKKLQTEAAGCEDCGFTGIQQDPDGYGPCHCVPR